MKYTYVTNYKNNDRLRRSFNALTEKTFGFNFVQWYENGFWGEKYIPHSLVDGEKMIANVSVSLMDFYMDERERHYIQIGTVMTDAEYRGQGLSRYLMQKVIDEYKDKVDGIYLFGNDSVLNFYPKFGFQKSTEYQYSKKMDASNNVKKVKAVDMSHKENWNTFFNAVKHSISNDRFNVRNIGIIAFWTIESDLVYYLPEEDAYIVAEVEKETLCIYQIIASHKVDLETVISSFGSEVKKVILGFTPYNAEGYTVEELQKEDCTLFVLGEDLQSIQEKKLMFPVLSHA